MSTDAIRRLSGQYGGMKRHRHPAAGDAARALAAERIAAYAAKVVAEAPPLTQDQCDRIAAVIRGGA